MGGTCHREPRRASRQAVRTTHLPEPAEHHSLPPLWPRAHHRLRPVHIRVATLEFRFQLHAQVRIVTRHDILHFIEIHTELEE